MSTSGYGTSAGYNCAYCGMWVANNMVHWCQGDAPLSPVGPVFPVINHDADVLAALIEIRDLLKQLLDKGTE